MMKKELILYIFLIVLCSCNLIENDGIAATNSNKSLNVRKLSINEYKEWTSNNLELHKEINSYHFKLKYLPVEWMVLKDNDHINSQDKLDSLSMNYSDAYYFLFSILSDESNIEILKKISGGNYEVYDQLVKYYSYQLQNDLFLVDGDDTLNCSFTHFERTFDANTGLRFFVVFDKMNSSQLKNNDMTFIYKDRCLDIGPIKLTFNKETLNSIPFLKINN